MILIANPIYDAVFKYLLEDITIARELLSTILSVDIVDLTVKPQETIVKDEISGEIKIFRLDFKAIVKLADNEYKTVLIELQKAKKSHDISRFRVYLGENYKKQEPVTLADGTKDTVPLEIVPIYILGFNLEGVEVPVLKVSRNYTDAITNEVVTANNEFITKLTHESYTIQIRRLKHEQRNKLEEVLEIFSQDSITNDPHNIQITKESKNPLVKRMVKRLSKAASSEIIKRKMEAEDMIDRLIDRETQEKLKEQAEAYEKKIEEVISAKEEIISAKEEIITAREKEIEEKAKKNEELLKEIEHLKKLIR